MTVHTFVFCDAKQFKRQARKDLCLFALFSQSFSSEVPLAEKEQHQLTELLIFTSQEPTLFPVKWMEKDPTNCNRSWTRPLETELTRETTREGRAKQGGRFPMLKQENKNTPYLKPTLSTLTFIVPKKQSLQTNLVSPFQFSGIAASTPWHMTLGKQRKCTATQSYFHRKSWLITYIILEMLTQVCKKHLNVKFKEQHCSTEAWHDCLALAEQKALLCREALAMDFILL